MRRGMRRCRGRDGMMHRRPHNLALRACAWQSMRRRVCGRIAAGKGRYISSVCDHAGKFKRAHKNFRPHARRLRPAGGAVLGRHPRPRREPEHRGTAGRDRGHAAVHAARFRLRARPRPCGAHRARPCRDRSRRLAGVRGHGARPQRLRGLAAEFLRPRPAGGRFDGVFANASLFHVPSRALPDVLGKLHAA